MSKVKEQLMKDQEIEMDMWISYMEYLQENDQDPTAIELDQMEANASTVNTNAIVPKKGINNTKYNQKQGA